MTSGAMRILRDRNAGLYLTGVVVSGFGTSAMALAAGVWVKSATGSSSSAAWVGVCLWLPTLFGPLIGPAADRARRRTVLVRANLAMAVVLLALLAVDGADRIWIVFAVMTLYGVSGVLIDAAESALVGTTIDAELRGDFNGLRLTANEGMKLLAPLAGAGLYMRYGGHAVALLDAATFALAAVAFRQVRAVEPAPRAVTGTWLADTAEGIRALWANPVLRRLVVAAAVTMAAAGLNGAAIYAVVDDGLHRAPEFTGVLYAVQGAGSVLAGLLAGPLLRRMPAGVFAACGTAAFAVGAAVRAVGSTPLALGGSALVGLGLPCVLVAAFTVVQREAPEEMLGRVAATANTLMFAPNAMTAAVGAGLLSAVDYRLVLVLAVAVAAAALWPALRGAAGSTTEPADPTEPATERV